MIDIAKLLVITNRVFKIIFFTLISIIDLIWGKSTSLKKWRWKTENIQVF